MISHKVTTAREILLQFRAIRFKVTQELLEPFKVFHRLKR